MESQHVVGEVKEKDEEVGAGYLKRVFTKKGVDPYDELKWEKRDAVITNAKGVVVFKQENVEVPVTWSQQATNIVVSKYFRGALNTSERETSVRQLIGRVARTITKWGRKGKYFKNKEEAEAFEDEL
ncbi:MAG: vitamin B12-dependent ribonucleotide reductase, partial [Candidatus Aenigmarchaeota archaeon]|nr:vitamin B12-dependent ribonucleotide reductase [Candidatus Aenigmarchaeota archaeon]